MREPSLPSRTSRGSASTIREIGRPFQYFSRFALAWRSSSVRRWTYRSQSATRTAQVAERIRRDVDAAIKETVALHRGEGSIVPDDLGDRIERSHVAPLSPSSDIHGRPLDRVVPMSRVLLTGMAGTGKSSALAELGRRGFRVVDTDDPGWREYRDHDEPSDELHRGEWLWVEDRLPRCWTPTTAVHSSLQGRQEPPKFYERFDAVVLLSAPTEVILERIARRSTNDYGKTPIERARSWPTSPRSSRSSGGGVPTSWMQPTTRGSRRGPHRDRAHGRRRAWPPPRLRTSRPTRARLCIVQVSRRPDAILPSVMIRPFEEQDAADVVALSLRAWGPVHDSLREVMGDELFDLRHQPDSASSAATRCRVPCSPIERTASGSRREARRSSDSLPRRSVLKTTWERS